MNRSIIRYVVGSVIKFEGFFLIVPMLIGLFCKEKSAVAFLITVAVCLGLGFALTIKKPKTNVFYALEGFVCVSLSWIALSILGALPFWLSGEFPNYTDALFEAISGFTTTGASILSDVECLSKCVIFWRSFTHWIGGMGVLVFVLAVLPMSGGQIMFLMKAESPGPSVEKLVPRVRTTATILYGVYSVLTVLEIVLLFINGMPLFDSVNLGLATAGTGGFGIQNDSCGSYTATVQWIITIFMLLFGVNFNIYYLLLRKKVKAIWESEELRAYVGIVVISSLTIAFNIRKVFPNPLDALRHAFFQVATVMTTTGFSTTDFALWPSLSTTILVLLMFVGACAGSTGGGLKISRFIILVKAAIKEMFSIKHPHGVRKVKMDGRIVEHETVRSVNAYMVFYVAIYVVSMLLVSLNNYDFTTNFTAVSAAINNIGPGLSHVGPTENFGFFSVLSKYVLMFDMLAGRLELLPMLVLFSPITWKKNR